MKKSAEDVLIEKTLKETRDQLSAYKRKMKSLLAKDMDYVFLKQLIEEVENGEDIEINIVLNDGTRLQVVKRKPETRSRPSFE